MQCKYLLAIYHNMYYNRTTILTLKALPIIYCQYHLVLFVCMHMIKNISIHHVNMSQSYNMILTLAPLEANNCATCERRFLSAIFNGVSPHYNNNMISKLLQ